MDNKESNHLLIDIAQRLSNIEGKLGALDSIDNNLETVRDTANDAKARADSAYNYAKENDKDISKMMNTIKWAVGLVITIMIPVIGSIITLIAQ